MAEFSCNNMQNSWACLSAGNAKRTERTVVMATIPKLNQIRVGWRYSTCPSDLANASKPIRKSS